MVKHKNRNEKIKFPDENTNKRAHRNLRRFDTLR